MVLNNLFTLFISVLVKGNTGATYRETYEEVRVKGKCRCSFYAHNYALNTKKNNIIILLNIIIYVVNSFPNLSESQNIYFFRFFLRILSYKKVWARLSRNLDFELNSQLKSRIEILTVINCLYRVF